VSFLARTISRARWSVKEYLKPDRIGASAVTNSLRDNSDELSLWECELDPKSIREIVLALVAGPKRKLLETFDLVLISKEDLTALSYARSLGTLRESGCR